METKMCLVACGAGFATSTVGAKACEQACKELGFKAKVEKRTFTSVKTAIQQLKPDVILLMTKLTMDIGAGDIPMVNGVPLITGKGKDQVMAELKAALSK